MRQLKLTSSLLLGLMLGVSACAGAKTVVTMDSNSTAHIPLYLAQGRVDQTPVVGELL